MWNAERVHKTKVITALTALVFTGVTPLTLASGTPKTGAVCIKANQVVASNGYTFQCVKMGKSLVWSKGTKVKLPTPTAKPVPSPITPTSFEDLYANRSGIAYAAWKSINSAKGGSPVQLPPIETYTGPNTNPQGPSPTVALQFIANLFPKAIFPKKIVVISYSFTDLEWGLSESKRLMGENEYQNVITTHGGPLIKCNQANNCDDGDSYIAHDGTDFIVQGLPNTPSDFPGSPSTYGGIVAVEFYHGLTLMPYFRNGTVVTNTNHINSPNFIPVWYYVGGEGICPLAFHTLEKEQEFAQGFAPGNFFNQVFGTVTKETFDKYLNISNLNNLWSNNSFQTFMQHVSMGNEIDEIFIALKGPQVLIDLATLMSQGNSFTDAFQIEFGTSWQLAEPVLAQVMYDKYLHNY